MTALGTGPLALVERSVSSQRFSLYYHQVDILLVTLSNWLPLNNIGVAFGRGPMVAFGG